METTLASPQPPATQPIYLLPQNKKRILIPKIVGLLALGGICYLGFILNLALLELNPDLAGIIKFASLAVLALLIGLETIRTIYLARHPARFFQDRIVQNKKEVFYTAIADIAIKRNLMDKLFKTYSLFLGDNFYLRHIPEEVQLENYLRELIAYSRNKQ